MTWSCATRSVSISGASLLTVTVVVTSAAVRSASTVTVWPTVTGTPLRSIFAKLPPPITTSYVPGCRYEAR